MSSKIFKAGNSNLVTGAAMGIGLSAAKRFAEMGMNVAMLDLPGQDLDAAGKAVSEHASGKIISVGMDVSDEESWKSLYAKVSEEFGTLHVLMNNAVTRIGRGFEASLDEWRKAFDVNFWDIVVGVNTFLPSMAESGAQSVIINVGSKQGITNPPGHPIYNVAKSAVKTYTEQLQHQLRNSGESNVSAHLLVPGWTTTGKAEHKEGAWLPDQVIDKMFQSITSGEFYIICPDDEVSEEMDKKRIFWGAADITENRPPLSRWHDAYKEETGKACN